jgi:hypothetical protein
VLSTEDARRQIIDDLAGAVAQLSLSTAALGEAFELMAEASADRLEDELFRPVQRALGRAKRTQSGFAQRVGLPTSAIDVPSPGLPSQGAKALLERAVSAAHEAEGTIVELQDSMLPVESGDAELRAGLTEVRESLAPVSVAARDLLRGLGR